MSLDLLKSQLDIKTAFQKYDKEQKLRLYKLACWFTAFGMPGGMSLDMNIYPADVPHFLKLRLLSSVLALILLGFFYTSLGLRYYRILCFILPLIPQGFISWMIYTTEGSVSPYYAGLSLILLAFCLLLPWSFQETLFLSLATIGFYLAACLAHGNISFHGIFFSNLYFLSMTALFATIGSYFTSRLRVREFIARFELDQNKRMLEESNRKLVELDKMKSRFFANISHELRTPLTLLIAPLETLQREKGHLFDEETRNTFKIMQDNAMRLLKLINDLLDLVKLESGRMEVRKEPLKVREFIKGLTLAVQGAAKDKKVLLSTHVDEKLETILADRDKLEKIILNLLFNSVKFTPSGGRIDISAKGENGWFFLQVKDTGMGISEENLPHIFDRFWQADSSAQRKYQGTGIGLSLVRELVEVQGGTVMVESQLGKGTTMTVKIPLERVLEVPREKVDSTGSPVVEEPAKAQVAEWLEKLYRRAELFPAMTPVAATLHQDQFGRGKKPKVLVADDEPDMLKFLKSQLEKYYEVVEAVDGNQAVEKAKQFLPDLVLLDMMMPGKDGIQACRELKEQVSTKSIPVILLTARADEDTKFSALDAGASDFLTKPFSTTELHVRIKNLMESHQFQRDLARQKSALESTLEQLKETEGQLVQNEKMASLGRLSAGIIHEINNPLNYAAQALYLLKTKKDRIPEEDRAKYVEIVSDIEEGVGRVQRIVSDLRTFSHPHMGGGTDLIELEEVVSTALRLLGHELNDGIQLEVNVPKEEQVQADRNKLIHVLVNLLQNSMDALKEKKFEDGEKPLLSIRSQADESKVWVSIQDNGTGIDPENMNKIFDPFFTTKDVGQGMGLGLSICYRIMNEQGGNISVKSEKGKFTEFTLELPVKDPPQKRF